MDNQNNLPALDNEDLRELGRKTVIDSISKIGNSMEEQRKNARISNIYLIVFLIFFVIMVFGAMLVMAAKSGGIGNFISNMYITDNLNTRINCNDGLGNNMTFRSTTQAREFMQIFNKSSCEIVYLKK